jgi:hypothetical protein
MTQSFTDLDWFTCTARVPWGSKGVMFYIVYIVMTVTELFYIRVKSS